MDKQLLAHYRAPQRDPVFGRKVAQPVAPRKPFWPLIVYGLLIGFAVVMCAAITLTHI